MKNPPNDAPVWRMIFEIADNMRKMCLPGTDEMIYSLTFNQLRMLKIVNQLNYEYQGGITLRMLADSLSIAPATASEMVDLLVKKGVLQRDHNMLDRRAVAIRLSATYRKHFSDVEKKFDDLTNEFLSQLSEDEQVQFIQVAGKFYNFISSLEE